MKTKNASNAKTGAVPVKGDRRSDPNARLSIQDLPGIVTLFHERAGRPLLPGAHGPVGLFVRYLRRKASRGLTIVYTVDEIGPGNKAHSEDHSRWVSLIVDGKALEGGQPRFTLAQALEGSLDVQATGVLRAGDLGLSVQAFPADCGVPALAACWDTSPHSYLCKSLQSAARVMLDDEAWRLVYVGAEPVRYKPGNRCVIRYNLLLEKAKLKDLVLKTLTIFGKVYAEPAQARRVQDFQQRLYQEQVAGVEK